MEFNPQTTFKTYSISENLVATHPFLTLPHTPFISKTMFDTFEVTEIVTSPVTPRLVTCIWTKPWQLWKEQKRQTYRIRNGSNHTYAIAIVRWRVTLFLAELYMEVPMFSEKLYAAFWYKTTFVDIQTRRRSCHYR
jgi:hypothetical protein